MAPMRRPIRLPKITKYSVVVTAEGTSVWPQMRMMRPNSRMMMVRKPIARIGRQRQCLGSHGAAVLHQAHEHLFQPVHLVAHRQHLDALRRKAARTCR